MPIKSHLYSKYLTFLRTWSGQESVPEIWLSFILCLMSSL